MAGWGGSEPDDFGSQDEVGEPGESGISVTGLPDAEAQAALAASHAGGDHRGSPYGQSVEEGSYDWSSDTRSPFKDNNKPKNILGDNIIGDIVGKQQREWSQAPGRKAAVSGASSFIAAKAGLAGGWPGLVVGAGIDMLASAMGLYGPTYPPGVGDTASWYGPPPPPPDDPHGGGDDHLPQPKKRKAPRPIYSAGSGNKPDLLVGDRRTQRRFNRGVYNV